MGGDEIFSRKGGAWINSWGLLCCLKHGILHLDMRIL